MPAKLFIMSLSQTSVAALEAGLTQIFPTEMDEKSFDNNQGIIRLSVKEINSEQFARLHELVVENNASIHQKRSGNGITISIS